MRREGTGERRLAGVSHSVVNVTDRSRPNFGRSWPTPRLSKAAIYSGEAPTEGLLWLADLIEARPTDFQGSSAAAFAGIESLGLKVMQAT